MNQRGQKDLRVMFGAPKHRGAEPYPTDGQNKRGLEALTAEASAAPVDGEAKTAGVATAPFRAAPKAKTASHEAPDEEEIP